MRASRAAWWRRTPWMRRSAKAGSGGGGGGGGGARGGDVVEEGGGHGAGPDLQVGGDAGLHEELHRLAPADRVADLVGEFGPDIVAGLDGGAGDVGDDGYRGGAEGGGREFAAHGLR